MRVYFNGIKVTECREKHSLTVNQLSRCLDLSDGHLSKIENNKYVAPRIDVVFKIANFFKLPVEDFLIVEEI